MYISFFAVTLDQIEAGTTNSGGGGGFFGRRRLSDPKSVNCPKSNEGLVLNR
jgi:hypothetical protein